MNRVIIILLCLCGAVVCAFLAYLGYKQDIEAGKTVADSPPEYSCRALIDNFPPDTFSLTLTEFQPGKHFIHDDVDENGLWERVVIPVFPADIKKLDRNYRAIFLVFANTPNKVSLFKKINSQRVEADFWLTSQQLGPNDYNRLAEKYTSMDFARSKLLYCGFPKSRKSFGKILLWAASSGALLSIFVLGWQSVSLVVGRGQDRRSTTDDCEGEVVINRAGLPTRDDEYQRQLDP